MTCKNFFKGFFAPTMSLLKKGLPSSVLSLHQEPGLLSILKSCVQKKQEVRLTELLGCIKSLYCRHLRFHTNLSIKNKKVFFCKMQKISIFATFFKVTPSHLPSDDKIHIQRKPSFLFSLYLKLRKSKNRR